MYGYDVGSDITQVVAEINVCLRRLGGALRPGTWLVDYIPALRYMPGYLDTLTAWHKSELQLYTKHLDVVRAQMVSCIVQS